MACVENNAFLKLEWYETLGLYVGWCWIRTDYDCQSNTYEILFFQYTTETFYNHFILARLLIFWWITSGAFLLINIRPYFLKLTCLLIPSSMELVSLPSIELLDLALSVEAIPNGLWKNIKGSPLLSKCLLIPSPTTWVLNYKYDFICWIILASLWLYHGT